MFLKYLIIIVICYFKTPIYWHNICYAALAMLPMLSSCTISAEGESEISQPLHPKKPCLSTGKSGPTRPKEDIPTPLAATSLLLYCYYYVYFLVTYTCVHILINIIYI